MNNGTKCALFVIFITALFLVAFRVSESLPPKRNVKSHVYSKSNNYKLNSLRNDVSQISTTLVKVTKPPKPVIKQRTQYWKKRGEIFYREIVPLNSPKLDILFLHGRKPFTSAIWANLKTMEILAAHGYHVVAMDLPAYGKSTYKLKNSQDKNRAKVLANFINKAQLKSPVIVSPSFSGRYSLPYIAGLKNSKAVSGLIAIAVEGTDRIPGKDFRHFPLTLILRGSKDTSLGVTSLNALKLNIPNTKVKVIEGAGNACYINKPYEFHQIVLKFLQTIMGKNNNSIADSKVSDKAVWDRSIHGKGIRV